MEQIPVDFEFKGSRAYVHGTDMHNCMLAQLNNSFDSSDLRSLRLTIHRRTSAQGMLLLADVGEVMQRPQHGVAEITATTPQGARHCWLTETGEPVTGRYPYDEEEIVALCQIADNEISIAAKTDYTPVEVVVAMNKALHLHAINDTDIKWLFTRLQLERPFQPKDALSFKVTLSRRFAADKLTQSAIFAGGQLLGHIYFSGVKV